MKHKLQSNEVVLPVKFPPIKTYPLFTDILSILGGHPEAFNIWLFNNHILLWISSKNFGGNYWADFKYCSEEHLCPFIQDELALKADVDQKYESVIDFVIEKINEGFYLFLNINKFYIGEYWDSMNPALHQNHEIFIFGYNKEKRVIHIGDFFLNEYKFIQVPFESFQQSYSNYHLVKIDFDGYTGGIWLKKFHNIDYQFDIQRVKSLIKDFLAATDTTIFSSYNEFKSEDTLYGMRFFDVLQSYLIREIKHKGPVDYRPFHLLHEFNMIMLMRIKYLKENGYLEQEQHVYNMFQENREMAVSIRNSIDKYNITGNTKVLEKQINNMAKLSQNEKNALECLLDLLGK